MPQPGLELCESMQKAQRYGLNVGEVNVDVAKMQDRKNKIVSRLMTGLQGIVQANNIEVLKGHARLTGAMQVEVDSNQETKQVLQPRKIILTPGSEPSMLSVLGADGLWVLCLPKNS